MANEADYKRTLKKAERELAAEKRELQQREVRIARLEQTVASLRSLINPDTETDLGLTDTIRQVLQTAPHPLRALDIRESLNALGASLAGHSNPMASVHAILARLHKSREVMELKYGKEKRFWWLLNGPPPTIATQPGSLSLTGHAPTLQVAVGENIAVADVPIGWIDSGQQAVMANYAHRQRAHTAAIQASMQTNNPALHQDTDKKKK